MHHHQLKLAQKFIQLLKFVKTLLELMVYVFNLQLQHVPDLIHVHKQQNKVHVNSVNFHVIGFHQHQHHQLVHVHH